MLWFGLGVPRVVWGSSDVLGTLQAFLGSSKDGLGQFWGPGQTLGLFWGPESGLGQFSVLGKTLE